MVRAIGIGVRPFCLLHQADLRDIPSPITPTMEATTPPISIHTDLSVGEPVKNRETSELNESMAMTPKTIRTMPPANSASEIALFMLFPFVTCVAFDLGLMRDDA